MAPQHHRLFFTLLQCFHHLSIMTQQLEGRVTHAFGKKHKHLNDFIKPAFPGPKIRSEIDEVNKTWVKSISSKLVEHYRSGIKIILSEISSLTLSETDSASCVSSAILQAKSHYGKKLLTSTIQNFQKSLPNSTVPNSYSAAVKHKPDTPSQITNKTPNQPKHNTHSNANQTPQQHTHTVKGHKNPLSNFFSCTLLYRGLRFRSLEHLYQWHKARFHDFHHLAHRIITAPHAGVAKSLSKEIHPAQISPRWKRFRMTLMVDLLNLKFHTCKIFRDTLMALPEGTHISHPVQDSFWGTGNDGKGDDIFGALLNNLRQRNTQHKTPTKPNHTPKQAHTQPPKQTPISNRFSPLQSLSDSSSGPSDSDWPTLSSTFRSPPSNISATPLRRPRQPDSPSDLSPSVQPKGKRTRFHSPKSSSKNSHPISPTYHKGQKQFWSFPKLSSPILAVLGASNINRITSTTLENIELQSYSGAQFSHFTTMCRKYKFSVSPKSIVLCIGLNDRHSNPLTTSIPNLKSMVSSASRAFPKSKIYLPKINFSAQLEAQTQGRLNAINKAMDTINFQNVTVLEPLDPAKFEVDPRDQKHIHWTESTANEMLKYWISHLN